MDALMFALGRGTAGSNLRHAETVERTGAGGMDALLYSLNRGEEASSKLRHTDTVEKTGLVAADPMAEEMAQLLDELETGKTSEADVRARLAALQGGGAPTLTAADLSV